jgi:hypothetical protein
MRFDWVADPVIQSRVTARTQCIHLPLPGTYRLNGHARSAGSLPGISVRTTLLHWEFRRDGGESCTSGAPNASGDLPITSSTGWTTAAAPAVIAVPGSEWTRNSSISVSMVMAGSGLTPPSTLRGWFDRIRLTLDSDTLFRDSFEN